MPCKNTNVDLARVMDSYHDITPRDVSLMSNAILLTDPTQRRLQQREEQRQLTKTLSSRLFGPPPPETKQPSLIARIRAAQAERERAVAEAASESETAQKMEALTLDDDVKEA